MGACCASKELEPNNTVNVFDTNQKGYLNEKTLQNDDCSILVSSYTNELNYNVKYRDSGKKTTYVCDSAKTKHNNK